MSADVKSCLRDVLLTAAVLIPWLMMGACLWEWTDLRESRGYWYESATVCWAR